MKKYRYWWIFGLSGLVGLSIVLGKAYLNPVVGKITSRYGTRINPISGKNEFHNGVDVQAASGTPVKSPAAGTVLKVYYNSLGGNQVIVQHTGLITGYAHLSKYFVTPGEKIQSGHIIGHVGTTGQSTGAHLHFTTAKNGDLIDPLTLFNFQS